MLQGRSNVSQQSLFSYPAAPSLCKLVSDIDLDNVFAISTQYVALYTDECGTRYALEYVVVVDGNGLVRWWSPSNGDPFKVPGILYNKILVGCGISNDPLFATLQKVSRVEDIASYQLFKELLASENVTRKQIPTLVRKFVRTFEEPGLQYNITQETKDIMNLFKYRF